MLVGCQNTICILVESKLSFCMAVQGIHIFPPELQGLPTDVWKLEVACNIMIQLLQSFWFKLLSFFVSEIRHLPVKYHAALQHNRDLLCSNYFLRARISVSLYYLKEHSVRNKGYLTFYVCIYLIYVVHKLTNRYRQCVINGLKTGLAEAPQTKRIYLFKCF